MEIACKSCGSRFNLPDEKAPVNAVVTVPCPKCRDKIVVDTRTDAPAGSDFFDDDVEAAMLCMPGGEEANKALGASLLGLGFRPVWTASSEDAATMLTYNRFGLILIDEDFDPQAAARHILEILQEMAMSQRRLMIVGLVSKKIRTFDTLRAFGLSVDFVVNRQDLKNITAVVKKAITDHEQFYKVFMECKEA